MTMPAYHNRIRRRSCGMRWSITAQDHNSAADVLAGACRSGVAASKESIRDSGIVVEFQYRFVEIASARRGCNAVDRYIHETGSTDWGPDRGCRLDSSRGTRKPRYHLYARSPGLLRLSALGRPFLTGTSVAAGIQCVYLLRASGCPHITGAGLCTRNPGRS